MVSINQIGKLQLELQTIEEKYKACEKKSSCKSVIPQGQYLCIRLDGFNLSKGFLKDYQVHKDFNKALSNANYQLFCTFRHLLNREFASGIICSLVINDEVSIVLSKDITNYERRVMKICTLFAGVLSSYATHEMRTLIDFKGTVAFDARPIFLLSSLEIAEYLRGRFLIGWRYANWKMLRLNKESIIFDGFDDVYDNNIKRNLDNAIRLAKEYGFSKEVENIVSSFCLCIPEKINEKPKIHTLHADNRTMDLSSLEFRVTDYLDFLDSPKGLRDS